MGFEKPTAGVFEDLHKARVIHGQLGNHLVELTFFQTEKRLSGFLWVHRL